MNKKELISAVSSKLREEDARKKMRVDKHKFYISDDSGNTAAFDIKQQEKSILYNKDDVRAIIDSTIEVMINAIRNGEEINIKGFGVLKLHKRAARRTKQPGTDTWFEVEERLVPKFFFGDQLRMAARSYELKCEDERNRIAPQPPVYDEDDY